MVSFTANKIFLDAEAVSEQLKDARKARKLKLHDVAKRLNINFSYLEALENNEFWKLPKGVYGKNFLKEYAIFLGLDPDEMLKIFEKEISVEKKDKEKALFSAQVVKNSYFLALPRIFRNTLIAAIIIFCFVYLGFRLDKLAAPPILEVQSPVVNLVTKEKQVEVKGSTETETQIVINGEQVLSDTNGHFAKWVDLKDGINIITITAKRKYGRANVIQRQVLVKSGLEL